MRLSKRIIGTVAYLGGLPSTFESFTWAWGQLVAFNTEFVCDAAQGEIIHYDKARVSLHDVARNNLATTMLGDWLVQLDTDHSFDPDLVARLVLYADRYGLDVVTANYRHRFGPQGPVLYLWNEDATACVPMTGEFFDPSGEKVVPPVVRIGSAGGGCLFVRRAVFDRIRDELHEDPFTRYDRYGEDHAFFHRCHRLDIPVYALPRVESYHLRIDPMAMADYAVASGVPVLTRDVEGRA